MWAMSFTPFEATHKRVSWITIYDLSTPLSFKHPLVVAWHGRAGVRNEYFKTCVLPIPTYDKGRCNRGPFDNNNTIGELPASHVRPEMPQNSWGVEK